MQHEQGAPAPLALPRFWEFEAPADWQCIDFISDLHLADDRPNGIAAFAAHLRNTAADAVFILGDLFDLWVGDDARSGAFESRCIEIMASAAARISIAFMVGNRDFLVGRSTLDACGALALSDPTVLIAFGRRVLLAHGDALCIGDAEYQRFRAAVRDERWQREFLAQPVERRHEQARAVRRESEHHKRMTDPDDWIDIDAGVAVRWMHEAATPVLVHGHTHCPGSEPLAPGFVRHVLSDWEYDEPGQQPRGQVLRLSAEGFARLPPALAPEAA